MASLIWKEMREREGLLLLLVALGAALLLAPLWSTRVVTQGLRTVIYPRDTLLTLGVWAWLLLAAVLLVLPVFAQERERGMEALLYAQPISRPQVWLAKTLAAILQVAAAAALPLAFAYGQLEHRAAGPGLLACLLGVYALAFLVLFASSLAETTYSALLYTLLGGLLYASVLARFAGVAVFNFQTGVNPWLQTLVVPSVARDSLVAFLLAGVPALVGSYLAVAHSQLPPGRRAAITFAGWGAATLVALAAGVGLSLMLG